MLGIDANGVKIGVVQDGLNASQPFKYTGMAGIIGQNYVNSYYLPKTLPTAGQVLMFDSVTGSGTDVIVAKTKWGTITATQDLRLVGTNNHLTQDAGIGSNGSSLGTGTDNIAIGSNTSNKITNASSTIAIGGSALSNLTSGQGNIAIGVQTQASTTTGTYNTAVGYNSLTQQNSYGNSTALGAYAMNNGFGNNNTAIGGYAGAGLAQNSDNTLVGANVLKANVGTNPTGNTLIGSGINPNTANITYANVVALGNNALQGVTNSATATTVSNSTFVGSNATLDAAVDAGAMYATAIGSGAKVGASNSIVLGRPPVSGAAQDKVGVGTITPNSTLAVKGSLETAYKEVTTATTLSVNDYYVTFNGTSNATITMPTVGSTPATAFTGRAYKIKNISNSVVTVSGATGNTFRNSGTAVASFTLDPGQYVEVVNNGNTTGATWDVSSINVASPPATTWQFDNIYDYTAVAFQDVTVNGTDLTGFIQSITVPANKAAKVVISYSIPLGTSANKYNFKAGTTNPTPTTVGAVQTNLANSTLDTDGGYYGVIFQKNGAEFPAGSRKSTVIPRNSNASFSMTTVSATVADNIIASPTPQTITYKLQSYLENVPGAVKYLMFQGTGGDTGTYNWGKGYWSIQVFLK
ncbi:beta strand repeat-containing protein [Empedobacter falsenii]